MTIDQVQVWESAASAFDARHQLIQPDHLAFSTPCADFDVAASAQERMLVVVGRQP